MFSESLFSKVFAGILFICIHERHHMKTTSLLIVVVCMFFFSSCTKNTADDSNQAEAAAEQNEEKFETPEFEDGSQFAVAVADAGMMEVQLATLALSKATSGKVKEFAQMMIDDHTNANEELKALAQKKDIKLPTTLSDKHQKKYSEMSEKTGADFDKEYCDLMVKDHKDVVDLFKKAQESSRDPEFKAWASEKLPTLEHHLSMAERMKESV
jgi:putative membrane protein